MPRWFRTTTAVHGPTIAALVATIGLMPAPAAAQAGGGTVYRCPGATPGSATLYTDGLTAQEAKDKGCRTIEGAPITIVQAARPRPPASGAATAPGSAGSGPARSGEGRVDPAEQRARESDARRILAEELRREEARLAEMVREFNNGEPERRGDERNFARYQERVAQMRSAIQRKEADLAAIRRELAKLPATP
jgi:hypothetical protein